jgi:hypothetical protein
LDPFVEAHTPLGIWAIDLQLGRFE